MSIASDANKTINVENVSNSTVTHDDSLAAVDQTFNTSVPNEVVATNLANETYDNAAATLSEAANSPCLGDKTYDADMEPKLNQTETLSGPGDKTYDHEELIKVEETDRSLKDKTITDDSKETSIVENEIPIVEISEKNTSITEEETSIINEATLIIEKDASISESVVNEIPEVSEEKASENPEEVAEPAITSPVVSPTQSIVPEDQQATFEVAAASETFVQEPTLEHERLESPKPVLPPAPVTVEAYKVEQSQFQESSDVEMKELEEFEESEDISMREVEESYHNIDEMTSSRLSKSFSHTPRESLGRELKTTTSLDTNDIKASSETKNDVKSAFEVLSNEKSAFEISNIGRSSTELGNIFTEKVESSFDVQFKMPSVPVFKQQLDGFTDTDFTSCGGSCKKTSSDLCVNMKCIY